MVINNLILFFYTEFVSVKTTNGSFDNLAFAQARKSGIEAISHILKIPRESKVIHEEMVRFFGWCRDDRLLKMFISLACGVLWASGPQLGPQDALGCVSYLLTTPETFKAIDPEDVSQQLYNTIKSHSGSGELDEIVKDNMGLLRNIALSVCHELKERDRKDESVNLCMSDLYRLRGSNIKIKK